LLHLEHHAGARERGLGTGLDHGARRCELGVLDAGGEPGAALNRDAQTELDQLPHGVRHLGHPLLAGSRFFQYRDTRHAGSRVPPG
jgi:hypothetical protein